MLAFLAFLSPAHAQTTITRDDWGIAHIHAHTDAQAVFGMVYAQAEDDFNRIEMNYLTALGRLSEAEGEATLMQDLRQRLYIDPSDLQARYSTSPDWLRALMDAWANGLNTYLATHPKTVPKVLTHFEPWMALAFSEGSIGGDIESISLPRLAAFYGDHAHAALETPTGDPTGSNGIAIAPQNTSVHHALLLINPHTSFYFRSELQMTSDEGLNAYGAATWGQFFLYQGFNEHLGWMHTSSQSDAVDEYLETVIHKDGSERTRGLYTRFGDGEVRIRTAGVTLSWRMKSGLMASKSFTIFRTKHGPVVGAAPDGRWISESLMFRPVEALQQAFALMKAHDFVTYMKAMAFQANSSNNTVYADADGHIAYLHPQFIPRRDDHFDYTQPVDGADPKTAWNGLHTLDEAPHLLDPATGFIQNTNNWPYSAAGSASPDRTKYPRYMDMKGENVRGLHALSLLSDHHNFTLETLVQAAYDSAEPGFDLLIPALLDAFDKLPPADPQRPRLADQIATLRTWDHRWAADSIPTSLAVFWGEALWKIAGQPPHGSTLTIYRDILARMTPAQMLQALADASDKLTHDFGTWRTPWGQINRIQRLTDDLAPTFSDAAPSLPVPFTSAQWGSLASITGPTQPGVKKRYGNSGNSFVAAIEFGPRIRAVAVTAGGESGDPASPHFNDEAARYATGALREVYFYPDQLHAHTARAYQIPESP